MEYLETKRQVSIGMTQTHMSCNEASWTILKEAVALRLGGNVPVGSASKQCLFLLRIAPMSESHTSQDSAGEWEGLLAYTLDRHKAVLVCEAPLDPNHPSQQLPKQKAIIALNHHHIRSYTRQRNLHITTPRHHAFA
jgi:hypothetical protein